MPASLNFMVTNDSALAASASYKAMELRGFEGRAGRINGQDFLIKSGWRHLSQAVWNSPCCHL